MPKVYTLSERWIVKFIVDERSAEKVDSSTARWTPNAEGGRFEVKSWLHRELWVYMAPFVTTLSALRLRAILVILASSLLLIIWRPLSGLQNSSLHFSPSVTPHTFVHYEWRTVYENLYVYSVYPVPQWDTIPQMHVVILADDTNYISANCSCRYHHSRTASRAAEITVPAKLEMLPNSNVSPGQGYNIVAGRLRCPYPEEAALNMASLQILCREGNRSGEASFRIPVASTRPPEPLTFAHCGIIYRDYHEPGAIIEFIEYYRLMGVSDFFWNTWGTDGKQRKVLQYYQQTGFLHLTEWILPFIDEDGKSVYMDGQMAGIYDCMLKLAPHYDYAIQSDLDEYFITSLQPPTFASIVHQGSSDYSMVRMAWTEHNATYPDVFDASGMPILRTSRITQRSSTVLTSGLRTKYIVRSRYVDLSGNHAVSKFKDRRATNDEVRDESPFPEETLILHMRREDSYTDTETSDRRGTVFAPQLRARVAQVWKEIFP
ncbi:hypothetical protein BV898_16991 [Hypsibius exemplaris]|uniref:Glycosyltransferase family 92 protein n=1 Tax=Hypsibius exemplaris TaxID=2072580 RepID=A0A9X6NMV9_HYPEX|nr:hypothetical protein BV898_16991 [Hypsibius exemplaris]